MVTTSQELFRRRLGLNVLDEQIAAARGWLEKYETERSELLAEMRKLAEEGHTTSDRLTDLLLLVGCSPKDPLEPKLRELQKRLEGKTGELVVIRYTSQVRTRFGGPGSDLGLESRHFFRAAILQSEELALSCGTNDLDIRISLPVSGFVQGYWGEGLVCPVSIADGLIEGDLFKHAYTGGAPPAFVHYVSEEQLKDDLLIGDEAVKEALKPVQSEACFDKICARLGRALAHPPGLLAV